MDLTTFVDVAIGLSVMYLGASLFVTIINEYIAQTFELRTRQLKRDLEKLIDDTTVTEALKKNPALEPFFRSARTCREWVKTIFPLSLIFGTPVERASFVDPNVLAQQVVGALLDGEAAETPLPELLVALGGRTATSTLNAQLQALARTGAATMDEFVRKVGTYLDRTLVAMGEVYKRKLQLISLGVGLGIAVAFNLDTVQVAGHLYRDKEARQAIAAFGDNLAKNEPFKKCLEMTPAERKQAAAGECKEVFGLAEAVAGRNTTLGMLPIGWKSWNDANNALLSLDGAAVVRWTGLLLTALAISLGASFWFDLLNRLVNIRHGMRRPEADTKPKGEAK